MCYLWLNRVSEGKSGNQGSSWGMGCRSGRTLWKTLAFPWPEMGTTGVFRQRSDLYFKKLSWDALQRV